MKSRDDGAGIRDASRSKQARRQTAKVPQRFPVAGRRGLVSVMRYALRATIGLVALTGLGSASHAQDKSQYTLLALRSGRSEEGVAAAMLLSVNDARVLASDCCVLDASAHLWEPCGTGLLA
jgi:hypothetical protein